MATNIRVLDERHVHDESELRRRLRALTRLRASAKVIERRLAVSAWLAGTLLVAIGLVALGCGYVYAPAGLIVGGLLLGAFGVALVDADKAAE